MTRSRAVLLALVGLVLALLGPTSAAADWPFGPAEPDNGSDPDRPATWGRTASTDHQLRPGCQRYRYRYRVTAPADEWMAEVFLTDPRGRGVGSTSFHTPEDAARGVRTWRLCRASVAPGRYTMRMKVTWRDGFERHRGWVRPSHFRMTRG